MQMSDLKLLIPDWPAPENIRAVVTTRTGGFSDPPFDGLNLAFHVGDDPAQVQKNWSFLQQHAQLPGIPQRISQIHGEKVVELPLTDSAIPEADGVFTEKPDTPCAIQTADCLPVLLCNTDGTRVAALHAGWRGLALDVLGAGVSTFAPSDKILAWLGPAICPSCFEVGRDVLEAFLSAAPGWGRGVTQDEIHHCFTRVDETHWLADIYRLARLNLQAHGVQQIYGGNRCTVEEQDYFYSYRRDNKTGRFASIIWMASR